ncbi:hypothetical protein DSCO28_67780 [Desulfosarcina ovata subsp. sediminis]|uniref:Uncharacterized protein n=1 Tax=Desulfosarcina ovata subsp. sediminis TaxID=885957 RepID=A0A5K8A0Z8_9BACT|nr:DUF997 domain-containing protein [Desulfosarcina ovata]BBO86212.1 hypothetical protein DSCO28_67780 [Desulfosarcina ovata subsp. sediminis]
MKDGSVWKRRVFLAVFCVLTVFCWCPIGYGSYGPASLVWGMPNWAVTALLIGVFMFFLEMFYLFGTRLTLNDDQLPDVIKALREDIQ